MEDFNEAMFKTKVDNIFVKLYTCIMAAKPLQYFAGKTSERRKTGLRHAALCVIINSVRVKRHRG